MDIVVVMETKIKRQKSEEIGQYALIYSGVPKECQAKQGVAVMIHQKYKQFITNREPIDERNVGCESTSWSNMWYRAPPFGYENYIPRGGGQQHQYKPKPK